MTTITAQELAKEVILTLGEDRATLFIPRTAELVKAYSVVGCRSKVDGFERFVKNIWEDTPGSLEGANHVRTESAEGVTFELDMNHIPLNKSLVPFIETVHYTNGRVVILPGENLANFIKSAFNSDFPVEFFCVLQPDGSYLAGQTWEVLP